MKKEPSPSNLFDPQLLLLPLADDIDRVLDLRKQEPESQFARRMYVRLVVVYIEGWINTVKLICSVASDFAIHPFTAAELALLRDADFKLDNNGQAVESLQLLKFEHNFRFAFASYTKLMGSDLSLNVSQHGWSLLRKLNALRNRLTHPRNASELIVSDSELTQVEDASKWFMRVTDELFDDGEKSYRKKRRR